MSSTTEATSEKWQAKSVMKLFRNNYHFFLELIFPKKCIGCGKFGQILCPDCQNQIKMIKTFNCPHCGRITRSGQVCRSCKGKNRLTGLLVAADYRSGPTKELIHNLKYNGLIEIAPILGGMLISRMQKSKLRGQLVLLPVPLHWFRRRSRGFNQAEVLARIVGKKLSIPVETVLKRKKNTKPQVELSGQKRRKNLFSTFICSDKKAVAGKTVILIDDVSTTGATLEECAKVLRTAGARQVWGLVVARG